MQGLLYADLPRNRAGEDGVRGKVARVQYSTVLPQSTPVLTSDGSNSGKICSIHDVQVSHSLCCVKFIDKIEKEVKTKKVKGIPPI